MSRGFLEQLVNHSLNIDECPEENYFEFYVSGYTQAGRQFYHQHIYKLAATFNQSKSNVFDLIPDKILWPFTRDRHNIIINLVPEPDNKFDQYAIKVTTKLYGIEANKDIVLGYVPKVISRIVFQNIDRINYGLIKETKVFYHTKAHRTKVAMFYEPIKKGLNYSHLKRALTILD